VVRSLAQERARAASRKGERDDAAGQDVAPTRVDVPARGAQPSSEGPDDAVRDPEISFEDVSRHSG
jgi:hypothetical protein